jgi:hypothetical protein
LGVFIVSFSRVVGRGVCVGWELGSLFLWGVFNGCCNWFQPKLGL